MQMDHKGWMKLGLLAGICASAYQARAQSTLAARTLVVYAANDADSQRVAAYYQAKRGLPDANLCPVWLPDVNATSVNATDYAQSIKAPVQNCLNAAGRENILYIVLAYIRPYGIYIGAGLDYYALDSYLADIWDEYTTQAFNPYPTRTHPFYVENQSQGDSFAPFQSLAAYRGSGSLPLIYSVWRLDAATPALAQGLIDNAMSAEAAGGPITLDPAGPAQRAWTCWSIQADGPTVPTGRAIGIFTGRLSFLTRAAIFTWCWMQLTRCLGRSLRPIAGMPGCMRAGITTAATSMRFRGLRVRSAGIWTARH